METWQAIALILLAVLVGATVPALLRLYSTLGAARKLLEQTGPKLDRTLSELEQTVKRLNRTGIVLAGLVLVAIPGLRVGDPGRAAKHGRECPFGLPSQPSLPLFQSSINASFDTGWSASNTSPHIRMHVFSSTIARSSIVVPVTPAGYSTGTSGICAKSAAWVT